MLIRRAPQRVTLFTRRQRLLARFAFTSRRAADGCRDAREMTFAGGKRITRVERARHAFTMMSARALRVSARSVMPLCLQQRTARYVGALC